MTPKQKKKGLKKKRMRIVKIKKTPNWIILIQVDLKLSGIYDANMIWE